MSFPTLLEQADAEIATGDPRGAFRTLRRVLAWPGPDDLGPALDRLARVGDAVDAPEIGDAARWAATEDVDGVVALASLMLEEDAPEAAATLLAKARSLGDDRMLTLNGLAESLEAAGLHTEACAALSDVPGLIDSDFGIRYRYAFNAVLSGDIDSARTLITGLQAMGARSVDIEADDRQEMIATIKGFIARYEALWPTGGPRDLRGWHWILEGSILLHQSPIEPADMGGRYAFVEDTERRVLEGALRAVEVVGHLGGVQRVLEIPDRDSAVLARIVAEELGVPLVKWDRTGLPGLMPIYDLHRVDPSLLTWLRRRSAGQIVWAHAVCWTQPALIAPDLVTFLYQQARSPWEGDTSTAAQIAERVASREAPDSDFADLPALLELVDAAREAWKKTLDREGLIRPRHVVGSPVQSRRYFA